MNPGRHTRQIFGGWLGDNHHGDFSIGRLRGNKRLEPRVSALELLHPAHRGAKGRRKVIVVALRQRIVFMIMASAAADG